MKLKLYNDVFEIRWKYVYKKILSRLFKLPLDPEVLPYRSKNYELDFYSFSDYWIEVGKRNALIDLLTKRNVGQQGPIGYMLEEVLVKFVRTLAGPHPCVVLYDINYSDIGRIWDRFPGVEKTIFNEDFVFLPVKTKDAARKLVKAVSPSLAKALAFSDGEICGDNYAE